MKKITLEIVVFVCGAVVMAYEIIGSRMLGPYVGTSISVWTSIIGIILLSLSAGYYFGGKLADKKPYYSILSLAIGLSGILILISTLLKDTLLGWMVTAMDNLEVISVIASILLFSLPAFFLGMVSPYAVKLKIKDVKTSGATAGYLYAISTAGSITGTFLAGFYLIPSFRISVILYIFTVILLLVSAGLFLLFKNLSNESINRIHHE